MFEVALPCNRPPRHGRGRPGVTPGPINYPGSEIGQSPLCGLHDLFSHADDRLKSIFLWSNLMGRRGEAGTKEGKRRMMGVTCSSENTTARCRRRCSSRRKTDEALIRYVEGMKGNN